jgi:hypothetical protein
MLKRKPTRIELRGDKDDFDELEQIKQTRTNRSTNATTKMSRTFSLSNDPFPDVATSKMTVEARIGYTDQQREALLRK